MKIDEFMKNPMGKGAVIPGKDQLLMVLDYRLKLLKEKKGIQIKIYEGEKDVYYHVFIPSENEYRDVTYDVIIKFKQTEKNEKFDQSYRQYQIEFFSNCPSFTYGYAYVANLNGYLIKELANKYESVVLERPPVSKNPGLIFTYEKSIYFACKYIMENKHMLLKSYVKTYSEKLTKNTFKEIKHMNLIEEEYKRADKIAREKKREAKLRLDKKTKKLRDEYLEKRENNKQPSSGGVNTVKKTKAKKPVNNKITPIKKKR